MYDEAGISMLILSQEILPDSKNVSSIGNYDIFSFQCNKILPCFYMQFIQRVVFARICTFAVDIMRTEFAKQHVTSRAEVIRKLLGSVFLGVSD